MASSQSFSIIQRRMFDAYHEVNEKNCFEVYHDAMHARERVLNLFSLGYCSLEHRALAEKLFFGICSKILRIDTDGAAAPGNAPPARLPAGTVPSWPACRSRSWACCTPPASTS